MKPLNHNNLAVILTYGVPTVVAFLGLLWFLKRNKDEDGEDKEENKSANDVSAAAAKSKTGVTVKDLRDSGDVVAEHKVAERSPEKTTATHVVDSAQTKLEPNLPLLNSSQLKSDPKPAESPVVSVQSSDQRPAQRSPVVEAIAKETSAVSSQQLPEASLSATKTSSSEESSLKSSALSSQSQTSATSLDIVLECSQVTELDVSVGSDDSSNHCSQLPDSRQSVADTVVNENFSSNCQAPLQSGLVSSACSLSASPQKKEISSLLDGKLEQPSRSEQAVLSSSDPRKLCDTVEEESRKSLVESASVESSKVQDISSTSSRSSVSSSDNTNSAKSEASRCEDTKSFSPSKNVKEETISDTNVKSSTQKSVSKSDSLENQAQRVEQKTEESTKSVISPKFSSDSKSQSSVLAAAEAATNHKVSDKKTSKTSDSISKDPKSKSNSASSKSAQSQPKSSSSPSKASQPSPQGSKGAVAAPPPSNNAGGRNRNQSENSEKTPDRDSTSRTSSGVSENGRADSGSPICDTNSEASNDSGRGGSVGDSLLPLAGGEATRYDFNFPSELCGRLIGRGGKNIQHIKDQSGATVTLSSNPFTPEYQICRIQGLQSEVDRALMMIRKKFPLSQFPRLDMAPLAPPTTPTPIMLPESLQLGLPEGVSIDMVVSAVVNAGHIFVQQPTHPSFPSLERLNHIMNLCYSNPSVPTLPLPVEGGIICAAESEGQWYRAQVMQVDPAGEQCEIRYLDYGGYETVSLQTLKQIRSDFMTLPFQAVECYLANITPLPDEEFFSQKAGEVLMELTSGSLLQGQVVARGDDTIGYLHLYKVSGQKVLMINREMVNREVVRWIEVL